MSDLPAPGMMGMPPQQPPMMPNPAFAQWAQMAQGWIAEKQRRQQEFAQACELIRSDSAKCYKIDIEADSTVAPDEQEEKASRTEFLKEVTPFLQTIIPGIMANPALAPLGKELAMFAVRAFKVSRQLEETVEKTFDELAQQAKQNPPQPQQGKPGGKSPMEIMTNAKIEAGKIQSDTQIEAGKVQLGMQENATKQMEIAGEQQIAQYKLASEHEHSAIDLALRQREMEGRENLERARMEHMVERDTKGLV